LESDVTVLIDGQDGVGQAGEDFADLVALAGIAPGPHFGAGPGGFGFRFAFGHGLEAVPQFGEDRLPRMVRLDVRQRFENRVRRNRRWIDLRDQGEEARGVGRRAPLSAGGQP
jgi:hypothetical protein